MSDSTAVNAHVEEVFAGVVTGSAALSNYRIVLSQQDAVTAIDMIAPPQEVADLSGNLVRDAVAWPAASDRNLDNGILILTSDAMWLWSDHGDGGSQPSRVALPHRWRRQSAMVATRHRCGSATRDEGHPGPAVAGIR